MGARSFFTPHCPHSTIHWLGPAPSDHGAAVHEEFSRLAVVEDRLAGDVLARLARPVDLVQRRGAALAALEHHLLLALVVFHRLAPAVKLRRAHAHAFLTDHRLAFLA